MKYNVVFLSALFLVSVITFKINDSQPIRGEILDRNGNALAINKTSENSADNHMILEGKLNSLLEVRRAPYNFRYYPFTNITSHLIGYVLRKNPKSETVGISGIEKSFNKLLEGGKNLKLALDLNIQRASANAMGHENGSVVVMNIHNGEVITLFSSPGYDVNHIINDLNKKIWGSLLKNPTHPLLNRATQAAYPPSEIFQSMITLSGRSLRKNIARKEGNCSAQLKNQVQNLDCHNHRPCSYSFMNTHNTYFYQEVKQASLMDLKKIAENWGLGTKTGIDLPIELPGSIPRQEHKMLREETQKACNNEVMLTASGNGNLSVTPLQVSRLVAAIANGGKILKPQLQLGKPAEVMSYIDIKPDHLKHIQELMHEFTTSESQHKQFSHLKWSVAGFQSIVPVASTKENKSSIRNTTWFMGYTPYSQPQFALAILLEDSDKNITNIASSIIESIESKFSKK